MSYFTQAMELIFDGVQTRPTMSTSVVLECQAGSEVWVQSRSNFCYVWSDGPDYKDSNFGAFLLQPLLCEEQTRDSCEGRNELCNII